MDPQNLNQIVPNKFLNGFLGMWEVLQKMAAKAFLNLANTLTIVFVVHLFWGKQYAITLFLPVQGCPARMEARWLASSLLLVGKFTAVRS